MRVAPTAYCLPDPDRPGTALSFATIEEGLAWFAAEFATDYGEQQAHTPLAGAAT